MSTDRPAAAPPSWDDNADEVLVEGMVTAVVVVVLALVSSLTSGRAGQLSHKRSRTTNKTFSVTRR